LLAISGVSAAALRGDQDSGLRYTGGVLSAMVGVVVFGYGVDSGSLVALLAGVAVLVVGASGAVADARRTGDTSSQDTDES
jgi:uncharacterized membrane protein HdeD (DUF308 family)